MERKQVFALLREMKGAYPRDFIIPEDAVGSWTQVLAPFEWDEVKQAFKHFLNESPTVPTVHALAGYCKRRRKENEDLEYARKMSYERMLVQEAWNKEPGETLEEKRLIVIAKAAKKKLNYEPSNLFWHDVLLGCQRRGVELSEVNYESLTTSDGTCADLIFNLAGV